jgi:hypothetical protein
MIDDITSKFLSHKREISEYFGKTDQTISAMDTMNKETQFMLKELKSYVEHFGDNLILASTQVTVESKVGFSNRPMSLQVFLLELCALLYHYDSHYIHILYIYYAGCTQIVEQNSD